jgi:hypothetical protein
MNKTPTAKEIQLSNLSRDLETLIALFYQHPGRASARRVRAVRLEMRDLAQQ